ncbi:hypothetical protein GCM10007377_07830 [Galliscardovia ingluviei]|uniref:Uncharacterized protein n=1 Tax=Galliscardovia ingluviei TaxID=1769422 RepID=A0A8J3AG66_9BIFI|nr:type II toxin-antitoxin system RelB/DinJ family antitoxin [Galliscardovia ingluviei]GGI13812.1 hypothetical protein GCM10007377_07830 [Galliscardovia ingluviei]
MIQIATRVDDEVAQEFKEITRQLGTTPADAMRMFIKTFNAHRGFPYEVRLQYDAKPLAHEQEALQTIDALSDEMIDHAW